jgi:hypothetical protein
LILELVLIKFEEISSDFFSLKYEKFLDLALVIFEKYLAKLGVDIRQKLSRAVKAIGDLVVSKSKIEIPFKERAKKLISEKKASVAPINSIRPKTASFMQELVSFLS